MADSETPHVTAGDSTSECNGLLFELRKLLFLQVKRLSIELMSRSSRVHDCLQKLLRLKERRASDNEEYECQIKNKTVRKGNLIERAASRIAWYLVLYCLRSIFNVEELRCTVLPVATNKHKPEVTAQRISSYAISASLFLWIFSIYGQTLLAKYLATKATVTTLIVVDMLGLFSFMVLVWALCVWILVGGKLSPMNTALLLIWATLELFNSGNSIDAVYLPILGIFFIGWHAISSPENKNQMEGKKLLSTSKMLNVIQVVHKGDSMEAADRKMTRKFLAFRTTSYVHILMEDTIHRLSYELYNFINKLKPQVTAQRISSYAISASMFLWIFLIYGQTLLAKYLATKARVSTFIVAEMLGLLSFMVLVWAVGVKILVGGKLSRMNCVLFLLWAILKLFNSDNSINAVCLPLLGIFFIGWHAMYSPENKNQMEGKKPLSTSMVKELS